LPHFHAIAPVLVSIFSVPELSYACSGRTFPSFCRNPLPPFRLASEEASGEADLRSFLPPLRFARGLCVHRRKFLNSHPPFCFSPRRIILNPITSPSLSPPSLRFSFRAQYAPNRLFLFRPPTECSVSSCCRLYLREKVHPSLNSKVECYTPALMRADVASSLNLRSWQAQFCSHHTFLSICQLNLPFKPRDPQPLFPHMPYPLTDWAW